MRAHVNVLREKYIFFHTEPLTFHLFKNIKKAKRKEKASNHVCDLIFVTSTVSNCGGDSTIRVYRIPEEYKWRSEHKARREMRTGLTQQRYKKKIHVMSQCNIIYIIMSIWVRRIDWRDSIASPTLRTQKLRIPAQFSKV